MLQEYAAVKSDVTLTNTHLPYRDRPKAKLLTPLWLLWAVLAFLKFILSPFHSNVISDSRGCGGRLHRISNTLILTLWLVLSADLGTACRTVRPLPAVNLSEPGWAMYEGQAIWRPKRSGPEIAGELLLARSQDGRSLVQFIKTPFPILVGQATPTQWQIEFPPQHRSFSGHGSPPGRLIWLHLGACLLDNAPSPKDWTLERGSPAPELLRPRGQVRPSNEHVAIPLQFRFENKSTGETLEGFLNP